MDIGTIWDTIILSPMINIVIELSNFLFNSFGLTIIVLTVVVRAAMFPLTRKQLQASKAMQELQPKIAEIRKKYARDRQRRAQEEMTLMKTSGVSPSGCLVPMLVQMPVWIGLYQSIIRVLAATPEEFLNLSRHLYTGWSQVFSLVPLENRFLWLDLATPDSLMLMPILVGGTMWLQQKMTSPDSADPAQRTQAQMMQWMFPLMFAFLTLSFPSGLALYWVASNIISIVMQYYVGGWGGLATLFKARGAATEQRAPRRIAPAEKAPVEKESTDADIVEPRSSREEVEDSGASGDEREDSRRGYRESPGPTGHQPKRGKGRRSKRR